MRKKTPKPQFWLTVFIGAAIAWIPATVISIGLGAFVLVIALVSLVFAVLANIGPQPVVIVTDDGEEEDTPCSRS